jgi:hypothetical protein
MGIVLAICGGRNETADAPFAWVDEIGRRLASLPEASLVYGACPGYPDRLVSAFLSSASPARVHGISPNIGPRQGWPNPPGVFIEYTDLGSGRNELIIRAATHVLILPGEWGTLSEACWALSRDIPIASPAPFSNLLNRCLGRKPGAEADWSAIVEECLSQKECEVPFSEDLLMELYDTCFNSNVKSAECSTSIETWEDLAAFLTYQ